MEKLRAEIFYDDESRNWHFQVPALHVIGGGAATRAGVERQCVDAVAFALADGSLGGDASGLGLTGGGTAAEGDLADAVYVVDMTASLTAPHVG